MSSFEQIPEDQQFPEIDFDDLNGSDNVWENIENPAIPASEEGDSGDDYDWKSEPGNPGEGNEEMEERTPFSSDFPLSSQEARGRGRGRSSRGRVRGRGRAFESREGAHWRRVMEAKVVRGKPPTPSVGKGKQKLAEHTSDPFESTAPQEASSSQTPVIPDYKALKQDLSIKLKDEGFTPHSEYVDLLYQKMMTYKTPLTSRELEIYTLGIRAEKICSNQQLLVDTVAKLTQECSRMMMTQKALEETRMKYESRLHTVTEKLSDRIIERIDSWYQGEEEKDINSHTSEVEGEVQQAAPAKTASGGSSRTVLTKPPVHYEQDTEITPMMMISLDTTQLQKPSSKRAFLEKAIPFLNFSIETLQNPARCNALLYGPSREENLVLYNGLAGEDLKTQIKAKIKKYFQSHPSV
ncbi:TPA_asm: P [Leucadendron betacytorhabdovirus 1]|nr:TPA_asm: P [Leucadendron betacytorhabdovirus 1]